jgi:sugar-specific transcriptional regulator TrmB
MLEPLFKTLGFSENEIRIYLTLAESGKSTGTLLAKQTKLARSTAYSVLESLISKGVVSCEQSKESTYYLPNAPASLLRMVELEHEDEERSYVAKRDAATELTEKVLPYFKSENFSIPKLQFFEGEVNVNNMLYDYCREWQKSISYADFTWWGYQDHQFVEQYREWLDFYWASMMPDEKIRLFSNKSEIEKKLRKKIERREIRPVPKGHEISSTIWALGEYVITIMNRQKPHYAFQLKDAVFAANQRSIFQLMWKLT